MPVLKIKQLDFYVDKKEEHGGPISYTTIIDVTTDFSMEILHPCDLKKAIIEALDLIIGPIRTIFQTYELNELLIKCAYG